LIVNTKEIMDACRRVESMVEEHDDDDFAWEDAIEECGLSEEDGLIVLALLHTAQGLTSRYLTGKIGDFLAMGLR
jgi:hypothetical protein